MVSASAVLGAVKDLTALHCHAVGNTWQAEGELVNSSKALKTYRVQLAVINPKTSGVLGQQEVTVAVPAGKSKSIHVENIYTGKAARAKCVPRVTLTK